MNGKAELVPLLIGCLKAARRASQAAELWLEGLDAARPHEIRRLAKLARDRTEWSADLLQQLDPLLAELVQDTRERSPVRKLIRGGGEAPATSRGAPLRLIPRALTPEPDGSDLGDR